MRKKYLLLCSVSLILVVACVITFYNQVRISSLCDYIAENNTEKSLEMISEMNEFNMYSVPPALHRVYIMMEADIKLPLVEASYVGNYDIVAALLQKGADPNKYREGAFSAMEAVFKENNRERFKICKLLLDCGADIDSYGSYRTALFCVLSNSMYAKPDNRDIPLMEEIIIFLLDHNAAAYDNNGTSVVHYLAGIGEVGTLDRIVTKYALQIDCVDKKGKTPLMWAVTRQETDMVKYLLGAGSDESAKDSYGKSAYDYAKESGDVELIELLLTHKTGDGSGGQGGQGDGSPVP